MQMSIIARNPTDHFTFEFFSDCARKLPNDAKSYYVWAEPMETLVPILESLDYSAPLVLLCISDNISLYDFNPWSDTVTSGVACLSRIFCNHPDTKFILITDVANLSHEFGTVPNLDLVELEYLTMQAPEWKQVPLLLNKNLTSEKTFISLNHRPAAHRITATSYMLSTALDQFGQVLISSEFVKHISKYNDYLDMVGWVFDSVQELELKPHLVQGFQLLKQYQNINDDYDQKSFNNFAGNFTRYLMPLYQNSFVELVAETYYAEPSFMATEKTLNNVYGSNFPIYISGAGIVKHLEQLGFDMFSDVVDHSYDQESNPFTRIQRLFRDNHQLLTDAEYAKQHWINCRERFIARAEFARNQMYSVIRDRARSQFDSALAKCCLHSASS
jgi:hypothetical protein